MAKTILVIDDTKELVEMLKTLLSVKSYKIIAAYDGEEGISKAQSEFPDLILLDVALPKYSGFTVCKKLKASVEYNKIPIIMLTAQSTDEDKFLGFQLGADAYITKPFNSNELLQKIDEFLH